jgi:hypothetical protein
MNKKEIAQWVIDNRYAKDESSKISDVEMYNHIIELMDKLTPIELPSDEEIEKLEENNDNYDDYDFSDTAFKQGVKWMKQQILNQNK